MLQPKKDHSSKAHVYDQEMMEELTACLTEVFKSEPLQYEDPFENYTHQLKMRLQVDASVFQHRFIHGYQVLMDMLHVKPEK